jgi:hypothetical protein
MRWLLCAALLILASPAFADPPRAPDEAPAHWSLRPRTRPAVPDPGPALRPWVRNPIDAFIAERLAREGLRPSPEADRRTLIRRLTFDLTGLPPAPEDVEAFVDDPSPDAYERLVDRLLASPRYGERWGRHWLDVVRFAETEGFEYDRHRPGAWRFRGYVIDAFNRDMPYDQFVREQLAGDEADAADHELLVAAGFHRLGPVRRNAGNQELAFSRHEVLTEMTDVVGTAFLGLTVGCARCHDHKFDDVSQADYYRLQAFFAAAQEHDLALAPPEEYAAWKARTDKLQAEIKALQKSLTGLKGEARKQAQAKVRQLQDSLPPPLPTISTVRNVEAERTPVHVLKRGNPDRKGAQVGPRLPGGAELPPDAPKPRTVLAEWVASVDNPLTARVMANRIWQRHFGKGLAETANDLGVNGSPPSHPELLDWLAEEFVAAGWRVKHLHRLIVTSAAYRQSSRHSRADGRLLARFPRRRLDAEEVRDAMLAVSGRLNSRAGGPSVVVPADPDLVKLLYAPSQWAVTPDPREHDRRSVYLLAKRNLRLPFMEAFDQPDAQTTCAARESSTHALQALELLNGRLANDLAASFADRLRREAGPDPGAVAERAYRLAAGRPPTPRERELAVTFLKSQPLEEFALAVFNVNAFLYVD